MLPAIVVGLLAGLVRAKLENGHLQAPELRWVWLVPIAFIPQWFAFYLPMTRGLVTDSLAAMALVSSQAMLLIFAGLNHKQPGFWALATGLALNLLVIILNGGLMPVSPDTVAELLHDQPTKTWQVGERIGRSVILPTSATHLWWLSDHLLLPAWFPYRKALSIGDLLIAGGAFWLLWNSVDHKTGEETGV